MGTVYMDRKINPSFDEYAKDFNRVGGDAKGAETYTREDDSTRRTTARG